MCGIYIIIYTESVWTLLAPTFTKCQSPEGICIREKDLQNDSQTESDPNWTRTRMQNVDVLDVI